MVKEPYYILGFRAGTRLFEIRVNDNIIMTMDIKRGAYCLKRAYPNNEKHNLLNLPIPLEITLVIGHETGIGLDAKNGDSLVRLSPKKLNRNYEKGLNYVRSPTKLENFFKKSIVLNKGISIKELEK